MADLLMRVRVEESGFRCLMVNAAYLARPPFREDRVAGKRLDVE